MRSLAEQVVYRTQSAFIWTRVLGVPFWGMIYLLSMILYKNMHITPLQITLIITLKPLSALFAPYWSQVIYQNPQRIVSNLVWANILRYLPFLFTPWIESSWIIIAAFGLYMMFYRGVIPTWMQVIKTNLPGSQRERLVGMGSTIDYCSTAILPLILAVILDNYEQSWRLLLCITAGIGLFSTAFLFLIPSTTKTTISEEMPNPLVSFKNHIFKPWIDSWDLLKRRTDFLNFQLGFMLGGTGLMIIQPALPMFFVDVLHLSYTKMMLAIAVFKGIGFAASTPLWVRLFRRWNIYYFSGIVTALASIFFIFLMSSSAHPVFLYVGYALYGIMQAGSDLSWHMSGPFFSKDNDSTLYSGTNVLAVGIRGCFVPLMGSLLLHSTNASILILAGGCLCVLATWHLMRYNASLASSEEEDIFFS